MLPAEQYVARRTAREAQANQFEKIHIRLGNLRLLLAAATAMIAWESLHAHALSVWWLAIPIVAFAIIAFEHSGILRRLELSRRAIDFYARGIARIDDRWAGTGETGERFVDPHHVYSADLDLFGNASLFQLLSTARTRMGEETLAHWLLTPSPLDQVRERHAAVTELRDQLDLREDLAVLGEDARVGVHPEALTAWAESQNQMNMLWMAWFSPLLAVLAIAGAVLWAVRGIASPFLLVILVEAIFTYSLKRRFEAVLHDTEHAFSDLELLSGVLERLESQAFRTPGLELLQKELVSSQVRAFEAIARLRTVVDFIHSRHNFFVRIIDAPLMYSIQVALAAERWRHAHGKSVRNWITVAGEIEALLSLASYSFEHPGDPFPEIAETAPEFAGDDLGHPLLPLASCVRNSVRLGGKSRVLLVSGSNMSGKSTLLRTIGINAVLAMAGAPVRASRLRLTPLEIGASIRINDSLREGSSRFYAEITRLRQIFDLAGGDPPLLFLLDELLQGTNSSDRRVGSEGVLRALVERGAIGLVTTHDLALTEIGGALDGHLENVHFQDEFAEGKISFDYKLREGIVTKSNGLELMRSIGLSV